MTMAFCIYGNNNAEIRNCLESLDYSFIFSQDSNCNNENELFQNLYVACNLKRKAEIESKIEFDICYAICSNDYNDIYIQMVIIGFETLNRYPAKFTIECLDTDASNNLTTYFGLTPSFFRGESKTFDRACEFIKTLEKTQNDWYVGNLDETTIDNKFYYHLKSCYIKTTVLRPF